jgi:hypothetical protein
LTIVNFPHSNRVDPGKGPQSILLFRIEMKRGSDPDAPAKLRVEFSAQSGDDLGGVFL